MAAIKLQTSTNAYTYLGRSARKTVRTSSGIPWVILRNYTAGKIEAWEGDAAAPTSFTKRGTDPTGYALASVACAIDSSGLIHCLYYSSSTKVTYNTFNTSTKAWGSPVDIDTVTAPAYYYVALALDASGVPHVAYTHGTDGTYTTTLHYQNKVGGSWNGRVNVVVDKNIRSLAIAIDTTNSTGHRYNLPQIATINATNSLLQAYLGNANNATSWTSVNPATKSASGSDNAVSIAIDSNGRTNIASFYNVATHYTFVVHIDGELSDTTWGTAGNWTAVESITGDANGGALSLVCWGTDRYLFTSAGASAGLRYQKSTNYGAWAAAVSLGEANGTTYPAVRWQYDNNPSYQTYGMDYIFLDTSNIPYWNMITFYQPFSAGGVTNLSAIEGVSYPTGIGGVTH